MDTRIRVRRAVSTDAQGIERVARDTWDAAYADIILPHNRERLLARWYAPEALCESIHQQNSWFFVALAADELVGFAQFVMQEHTTGRLTRIYVLPGWQRKAIGTLLLREGLAALSRQGAQEILVEVEKDNPIGRAFYQKVGFRFSRELSLELPGQSLALEELVLELHGQESAG